MLRIQRSALLLSALLASAVSMADDELPASLVRIPESVNTVFVAETSTAKFHRFVRSGKGLVRAGSFYMSIGRKGAGKSRSGDKRTPLGVYFTTEQLDTSQLHEKYGVTAFPLDYPNAWDQRAGRNGDGIWIHGVYPGRGRRPERDTDGCIALPNETLAVLAAEFEDNVTPVLVTRKISWRKATDNDALQGELENRVAEWATSKQNGDLYTLLSLYDDDFGRWGMDKAAWSSFNLQTAHRHVVDEITISDLLLLAYPGEEGLYLSRFRQTVKADGRKTAATTRLYWHRDATSGHLKILAEDAG